jgi:hypothetical protein
VNVAEAEAAVYADVAGALSRTAAVLERFEQNRTDCCFPSILETELESIATADLLSIIAASHLLITTPDPFGTGIGRK